MEVEQIIKYSKGLSQKAFLCDSSVVLKGIEATAREFLATYGGRKNAFLEAAQNLGGITEHRAKELSAILDSFTGYIEEGLLSAISPQRQAELDVVSDLLEQAQVMLESNKVHPAAPAVLIGATLEEFLRTWAEDQGVSFGGRKRSLDTYSKVLREADFISKQDVKDIISWAGIRNHAAHGEWDQVADKGRVNLMLEGVNLFMRKYTS